MLRARKVDLREFDRQIQRAQEVSREIVPLALDFFKKTTPIQSGNARRRTRREDQKIVADYPYAERLDQGSSRQAPDGMSEPTIEFIEKEFDKRLRGL